MTTESTADGELAVEDDDRLPAVAAALQQLVDAGLGPAIGLRPDWRRRSAIDRVARLGPEELEKRFEVIHHEQRPALVRYATRILGNEHDAEEVVSEAFLRVWKGDPDLEVPDNLVGYLRAVVRNEAYDRGRQTTRDRQAREAHDPVDLEARLASLDRPLADRVCDEVTLAVALHVLSERQRQCFILRVLGGLRLKEIAKQLGISEGNVKRICSDVRSRLAAALAADAA